MMMLVVVCSGPFRALCLSVVLVPYHKLGAVLGTPYVEGTQGLARLLAWCGSSGKSHFLVGGH